MNRLPRNETAGAVSAVYRQQAAATAANAGSVVAADLGTVDLNLGHAGLADWLAQWENRAESVITGAQQQSAALAHAYLLAYLTASGDTTDPAAGLETVNFAAHVGKAAADGIGDGGVHHVGALLAVASTGLLWALGAGQGRDKAIGYGQTIAARAAATATGYAGGATLTDLMQASPEVTGWRRLCITPTCRRCADQAAKGVQPAHARMWRHPHDDCIQEPVVRGHSPLVRAAPQVNRD